MPNATNSFTYMFSPWVYDPNLSIVKAPKKYPQGYIPFTNSGYMTQYVIGPDTIYTEHPQSNTLLNNKPFKKATTQDEDRAEYERLKDKYQRAVQVTQKESNKKK